MNEKAHSFSLKRRLLVALLGSITLAWLATAVFSYFDAQHELDELLDAHLAQSASLLVAQVGHEQEEIDTEHAPQLHKRGRTVVFQIWERGTTLRLHSVSAPAGRLSRRDDGFSDTVIAGKRWRVFSGWDEQRRYLVQVGERYEARDEIAASIGKNLVMPLLFALPALGLLVWLNVARGLKPLAALGRQVAQREPRNLGVLETGGAPVEVMPLVESLNRLFRRVTELMENERRFTADAAHELRTPLASLRIQAQVARAAMNDAERYHALDNVIAGCDRATHLVAQLLTLARLEPEQLRDEKKRCDLHALAKAVSAEVVPLALARNVEIELAEGLAVDIQGYAGLIAIALRNVIDNAVRYSPGGSTVHVETASDGTVATLTVTDQGPGIAAEERSKVGQRFYRILGSDEAGSGLGLSIVKRIAELHGAKVSLNEGDDGKGLRVVVTFTLSA
jgi:two-component system sensor histidine kinase QseC